MESHIQNIISFENVPRKEKAFRNFASNSLKLYGSRGDVIISSLWKHFSAIRQKRAKEKEINDNVKKNELLKEGAVNLDISEEDHKCDNKVDDQNESVDKSLPLSGTASETKAITKVIKKALKKSPKHKLKIKELRKIVKAKAILKDEVKEKQEWNAIIKEAVLKGKKSMKMDGKNVILLEKK